MDDEQQEGNWRYREHTQGIMNTYQDRKSIDEPQGLGHAGHGTSPVGNSRYWAIYVFSPCHYLDSILFGTLLSEPLVQSSIVRLKPVTYDVLLIDDS